MPNIKLLIELLTEMSKDGDSIGLPILKELLLKISESSSKIHIDVDYNGQEFFWRVPMSNITSREWRPNELRPKHESKHIAESER